MIKNIIFDFGGVIYPIDHEKTKLAFSNFGLKNFEELYSHAIQTHLFESFEKGFVSPQSFRTQLRAYSKTSITNTEIDAAWNALLLGFDTVRLELIKKVSDHYRIFLLSNTNQIHHHKYYNELRALDGYETFFSSFEKLYFSHQIGMRKPDKKIFNFVLNDSSLKAQETAFIDDYNLNIDAANSMGIQGILLKSGEVLTDYFSSEGILIPDL